MPPTSVTKTTLAVGERALFWTFVGGAVIGATVIGIGIAVFDALRDRLELGWSLPLLALAGITLAATIFAVLAACWGASRLIGMIGRQSAAAHPVEARPGVSLNERADARALEPPASVVEHTTLRLPRPEPGSRS